jgi:tetratricopeptide (TPR) repeat protein
VRKMLGQIAVILSVYSLFGSMPYSAPQLQEQGESKSQVLAQTTGEKLIHEQKYKEAISFYRSDLTRDPGNLVGRYNLSALLFESGDYQDALRHIEAAIKLRRDFPLAWFLKGEILIRLNPRRDQGEADLDKILECFENSLTMAAYSLPPSTTMKVIAWSWKATFYTQRDRLKTQYPGVMECLNQAAAMAGDYEAALLLSKKAVFQYTYKRYPQCLSTLESAISKFATMTNEKVSFSSEIAALHNLKGLVYYQQKQLLRALEEYDEAIRLLESSDDRFDLLFLQGIFSNKGLLYASTGQNQDALGFFRRVDTLSRLRDAGYLHNIPLNKAVTLFRMGEKEEALEQASGFQATLQGLQYLFENSKIYLTYQGEPEMTGIYYLSSPVDIGDSRVPGKRPIELSSVIYRDPAAIVTHLEDMVIPPGQVALPVRTGSIIVEGREKPDMIERPNSGRYYRNAYAYVIGINDYDHVPKLQNAASDARKIYEQLKFYQFDKIELILNHDATKARIESIFDSELSSTTEEDGVFIFYAGHGYSANSPWTGQSMGYIVPADGRLDRAAATCLSMDVLKSKIQSVVKARHVLLILDCCYSGLINRGLADATTRRIMVDGPQVFRRELQAFSKKRVFQYISAGDQDEDVPDVSVFMQYLLEALDPNAGILHMTGLREFTSREVYAYLLQPVFTATQKQPQKGNLIGNGEFIFSLKQSK